MVMDIPYDLWDETPAEVTKMHRAVRILTKMAAVISSLLSSCA